MSLYKSAKRYEKESEESVKVKRLLDAHAATYPEARKAYDEGRAEVIRLTGEASAVLQAEGKTKFWWELRDALRVATLKRDKSLHEYGSVKHDLELELERLNRFFIAEELERWGDETKKVKGEKVDEVVPKEKDEPGTFTMGGSHRKRTNVEAIRRFQLMSLEKCNQLRDMTRNSIPEIEAFIEEAEAELRGIDLTPQIIELDAVAFQRDRQDSRKEPGKMASGVLTKDGGVEITPGRGEAERVIVEQADRIIDHLGAKKQLDEIKADLQKIAPKQELIDKGLLKRE